MPPPRRRPRQMSPLGEVIWDAMERRSSPGNEYTYTELQADILKRTGHNRSIGHIRNVVTGERNPLRDMLLDLATALDLDRDHVLMLGGFLPDRLRDAYGAATHTVLAGEAGEPPRDLLDEFDDIEATFDAARTSMREMLGKIARGGPGNAQAS